MSRSRMPLEQLLANLQSYHTYLEQDKCANRRAKAYVEQQISFCQSMSSLKKGSTDSGEQGGCETRTWCSGPRVWNDCNTKMANATT